MPFFIDYVSFSFLYNFYPHLIHHNLRMLMIINFFVLKRLHLVVQFSGAGLNFQKQA